MINICISLSSEFQKNLSDPTRAHGLIDHRKDIKQASDHKYKKIVYHVKDNKDAQHK